VAKAKLEEEIRRARSEAINYTTQLHGPDSAREIEGTVALHQDTSLLVAAGQAPFVDMVESILEMRPCQRDFHAEATGGISRPSK
jgi:hypothetical protein